MRVVVGARQTDGGDALQAVATLWVMDDSGDMRCQIAIDHEISQTPMPVDAEGIGTFLPLTTDNVQLTTPCAAGTVAQAGDRIVAEIGYRCTASGNVEGAIIRGGKGPALTEGGDPTDHTCGQPGYVELDGDWVFASDTPTPCEADAELTVLTTRRTSITINASNRATAASIVDPDGTPREYEYTYDTNGALDTKTDVTDPNPANHEVTNYDYDAFGNLRHVDLPDGRTIDYLIDAANRRVGRVLKDDTGTAIDEKRWLYQSALRPVAELDGGNNVTSFFVYADRPNVPEYMVKGGIKYRIITDHLGSVRLVVNSTTGAIAQRIDYDEWGNVTQDTSPGFQPFGFAGGLYESEIGLVRFWARDMVSELGSWATADPIGFAGGSTNVRVYALGDPINRNDVTGLRDYSEGETRLIIEDSLSDALSWDGLIRVYRNHQGAARFDFCVHQPSDTFTVSGERMNACEFGNFLAGYSGQAAAGSAGFYGVRGFGVLYDFTDAQADRLRTASSPKQFDWDSDSIPMLEWGRSEYLYDSAQAICSKLPDPRIACEAPQ